jgi:hypothetical protein
MFVLKSGSSAFHSKMLHRSDNLHKSVSTVGKFNHPPGSMWNMSTYRLLINSLGLSEWTWGLEMGGSMVQKGKLLAGTRCRYYRVMKIGWCILLALFYILNIKSLLTYSDSIVRPYVCTCHKSYRNNFWRSFESLWCMNFRSLTELSLGNHFKP